MDLHQFHVYIITNATRTVLYVGVTNDLPQRLMGHFIEKGKQKTFAGRYKCCFLIYSENFHWVEDAILREKEIKGRSRAKKERLIEVINPKWEFLNETIMEWPPDANSSARS
jgi:putative endonuclease